MERPKGQIAPADEKLPQASGGRKEYTDDSGRVVKVIEWFGLIRRIAHFDLTCDKGRGSACLGSQTSQIETASAYSGFAAKTCTLAA